MGNVTFVLDSEEAKAVQGFRRLIATQKKSETAFRGQIRQARRFDRTLGGMKRTAMTLAGGFVGAAGVSAAVRATVEEYKRLREESSKFESEMTGLLSLGDNLSKIASKKDEVLELANAFGITRKEIADALFSIQSGASHLSEAIQKDVLSSAIELTRLTGTELPLSVKALLKTYLIYGKTLDSVSEAQAKINRTAELGFLTFEDLARLLPDVAAVAEPLGHSLDELGGALVVATQRGGRSERTFTGVRNVILRMDKAIEEGYTTRGSLLDQLRDLSSLDASTIQEIFGAEAVAAAQSLTQNVDQVEDAVRRIGETAEDAVGQKLSQRLKDAAYGFAELRKSIQQWQTNIPIEQEMGLRGISQQDVRHQLAVGRYREAGAPKWLAEIFALSENIIPNDAMNKIAMAAIPDSIQAMAKAAGVDLEAGAQGASWKKGFRRMATDMRKAGKSPQEIGYMRKLVFEGEGAAQKFLGRSELAKSLRGSAFPKAEREGLWSWAMMSPEHLQATKDYVRRSQPRAMPALPATAQERPPMTAEEYRATVADERMLGLQRRANRLSMGVEYFEGHAAEFPEGHIARQGAMERADQLQAQEESLRRQMRVTELAKKNEELREQHEEAISRRLKYEHFRNGPIEEGARL